MACLLCARVSLRYYLPDTNDYLFLATCYLLCATLLVLRAVLVLLSQATSYEGGVRAVGFFHWLGLPRHLHGSVSHVTFHVADWLPTLVR